MATDTYTVGGKTVTVESYIGRRLIATAYGIRVKVKPERKWWCVWLCKRGTSKADLISATADLRPPGTLEIIRLSGGCRDCESLTVKKWDYHTPSFGGPGIDGIDYVVDIRIGQDSQQLTGSFILN